MSSVVNKYIHQVRRNVPVVYAGMEWHPLTVKHYELYERAKPAFELMQASLRIPRLARLPWCSCLWALDEECRRQTGKQGDALVSVLSVVAEALRLDAYADAGNRNQMSFPIRPVFAKDELASIVIGRPGQFVALSMQQMTEVRAIIAAQNGYEIPDETWNPELVKAAQQNAKGRGISVEQDLDTLVFSVAYNCGCRTSEIYDWPIREFLGMQNAIDRTLNYQIYTLAENAGYVKFTNGNPFPTWKFDRKNDMPAGFKSIAEIDAGAKGLIAGT